MIAATGADRPAYAGRLTRAVTMVINGITSGELDLAPTVRALRFDVLFERIRKEVRALALAEGGHLQDPTATPVMGAQPELPFFSIRVTRRRRREGLLAMEAGPVRLGLGAGDPPWADPCLEVEVGDAEGGAVGDSAHRHSAD